MLYETYQFLSKRRMGLTNQRAKRQVYFTDTCPYIDSRIYTKKRTFSMHVQNKIKNKTRSVREVNAPACCLFRAFHH